MPARGLTAWVEATLTMLPRPQARSGAEQLANEIGVAEKIDLDQRVPRLALCLRQRLVGADARKVDQHVERAERFHRLGHGVRRRLFAADIGDDRHDLRPRNGGANAGCGGLHRGGIVVDQHHAAALLAKQRAGGGADPAGASGDDGDLAGEAGGHGGLQARPVRYGLNT